MAIAQGRSTVLLGADEFALDRIVRRRAEELEAILVIAGDEVARLRCGAPHLIIEASADAHAVDGVALVQGARGVGAYEVALDLVAVTGYQDAVAGEVFSAVNVCPNASAPLIPKPLEFSASFDSSSPDSAARAAPV